MLVCVFAVCICTRDRGCGAHPVFPAPLFKRAKFLANLGRNAPRDCETVSASLRAQRRNPPLRLPRYGLLRCARNDGERILNHTIAPCTLHSFSPCGRRWRGRSPRRMKGLYRRRQTPHPSRCRFASIADAKHRRPFLSTAADGRLCHPLPQGERGAPSACRAHFLTSPSPPPPSRSASPAPPNTSPGETVATDP